MSDDPSPPMLHMRRGLSQFDDLNFLDADDIAEEDEELEEDEEVEEVEDSISSGLQLPPAMPPAAPEAAAPTKRLFSFSAIAVQPPPPTPVALGPPKATPGAQVGDSNSSGLLPPMPPAAPEAAIATKPLFTFSAIAVQPPPPTPAALGPPKAAPRAPPRPPPNPFDASQQLGDPGAIQELLEQYFALRSCMLAYKVANSGSVVASIQSWKSRWVYLHRNHMLVYRGGAPVPERVIDLQTFASVQSASEARSSAADSVAANAASSAVPFSLQQKRPSLRNNSDVRVSDSARDDQNQVDNDIATAQGRDALDATSVSIVPTAPLKRHLSSSGEIIHHLPRIIDLLQLGRLFEAHRDLLTLRHAGRAFGRADEGAETAHPRFRIDANGMPLSLGATAAPMNDDSDSEIAENEENDESRSFQCTEHQDPVTAATICHRFKAPSSAIANECIEAFKTNQLIGRALNALQPAGYHSQSCDGSQPPALVLSNCPTEIPTLLASQHSSDRDLAHRMLTARLSLKVQHRNADSVPSRIPIMQNPKMEVSMNEVFATAQTGDIVLFRSKGMAKAIYRAALTGDYDHVGLVVRFGHGKVGIFEAIEDRGVTLFDWADFISQSDHHEQYERVSIRYLEKPLTRDQLHALQAFARLAAGAEYRPVQFKMNRQKSVKTDATSFSCSQLVAKAYKRVGLLRANLSSSAYEPGDFCAKTALRLLGGHSLSAEFTVVFDHCGGTSSGAERGAQFGSTAVLPDDVTSELPLDPKRIEVDNAVIAPPESAQSLRAKLPVFVSAAVSKPHCAPAWVPDEHAPVCMHCRVAGFGMMQRRHHCRNCGAVVCAQCSRQSALLPHLQSGASADPLQNQPQRVCDSCHEILQFRKRQGDPQAVLNFINDELSPMRILPALQLKYNWSAPEHHASTTAMRLQFGMFCIVSLIGAEADSLQQLRILAVIPRPTPVITLSAAFSLSSNIPLGFDLMRSVADIEAIGLSPPSRPRRRSLTLKLSGRPSISFLVHSPCAAWSDQRAARAPWQSDIGPLLSAAIAELEAAVGASVDGPPHAPVPALLEPSGFAARSAVVETRLPQLQFASLAALVESQTDDCLATIEAFVRRHERAKGRQVARMASLYRQTLVPVTWENAEHEALLRQLWALCAPADGTEIPFPGAPSDEWRAFGFQGSDPKTDFRGMGLFGLVAIVYFFEHNRGLCHEYVSFCRHQQSVAAAAAATDAVTDSSSDDYRASMREYPLAVAVINFCSVVGDLVDWKRLATASASAPDAAPAVNVSGGGGGGGDARPAVAPSPQQAGKAPALPPRPAGQNSISGASAASAADAHYVVFHLFSSSDGEFEFENLLSCLVQLFDRLWLETAAGYMDFPFVLTLVRACVAEELALRPLSVALLAQRLKQRPAVTPRDLTELKRLSAHSVPSGGK